MPASQTRSHEGRSPARAKCPQITQTNTDTQGRSRRNGWAVPGIDGGTVGDLTIAAIPAINLPQLYEVVSERLPADRQSFTIRALQEFPDRPVFEVAPEIQQNHDLMVSFCPWSHDRHSWLMLEDIESAAPTIDPTAIILAYDGETAQMVNSVLGYHWRQSAYPDRNYPGAVFIFLPADAEHWESMAP